MCLDRSPECQDLWDFFAEHIRVSVERYQTEEVVQSHSEFLTKETSTMPVLNNFVENLLGLLSDMDKAEVRIPIRFCRIKYSLNPYLKCRGYFCEAYDCLWKADLVRGFENQKEKRLIKMYVTCFRDLKLNYLCKLHR